MKECSLETKKIVVAKINTILKKLYPHPKTTLVWKNPLELLIAVMLSAQCTDKKVNEVTEKLFKKYKTINDYLSSSQHAFEADIHSTGFYKTKAKNIRASLKMIKNDFHGHVPKTMTDLLRLHGVARKTANVVLSDGFGIIEGIVVDTHVKRLSKRFGLTKESDPKKIEQDLMDIVPKNKWRIFSHNLIFYGREYCTAKTCPITHPLHIFDFNK